MPWPQTGATHYHAKFGLPDKVRAIIGLVVCFVAMARINELLSLNKRKVRGLVPYCDWDGYPGQVLQHPIDLYNKYHISNQLYLEVSTKILIHIGC